MKSILISIKPKWVAKILNGEKTIEIRKTCPKQLRGDTPIKPEPIDVYIYCTKEEDIARIGRLGGDEFVCKMYPLNEVQWKSMNKEYSAKGKVVAKFTLNKVEEYRPFFHWCIEKETCLTRDNVLNYLDSEDSFVGNPKRQGKVYAWHISNLEIFDRPRELSEFKHIKPSICGKKDNNGLYQCDKCIYGNKESLECRRNKVKAPQSWQFVESENDNERM